jgi:hypothetical protein
MRCICATGYGVLCRRHRLANDPKAAEVEKLAEEEERGLASDPEAAEVDRFAEEEAFGAGARRA